MTRCHASRISVACFLIVLFVFPAKGQAPAPPSLQVARSSSVTVDDSEAMFTTMCALYAAGFDSDVSEDNWSTYRAQIRERVRQQKGPAVDAIREFYARHQLTDPGALLSRYIWFGLVSGSAPKFQPILRRDELPPEVIELEDFNEILSRYYTEQNIGSMWRQVQPVYNGEIDRMHDSVARIVLVATSYLREVIDPSKARTFTIIVEPLVGRITNVRNYGDQYSIILSGDESIPSTVIRHAFLHFLLDPLPLTYSHVTAVKRPVYEVAAAAPRLPADLRADFASWFAECTVRAVELKLQKGSPSELEAALSNDDAAGYVFVRPIFNALPAFENSEPSMHAYFPELLRSIDVKTELARVSALKFAPAQTEAPHKLSSEEVARKRSATVTTLPNDEDAISALTEGERYIAAKNPRKAETSFKAVLAKYPDQTRAWYGLGLVALMDHDGVRAKEVFGRLTTGPQAAQQDPMVLSWSHVYLGRIYADEDHLDRAKAEFQAALDVQGASPQVQQAAQKGLGELSSRKPAQQP